MGGEKDLFLPLKIVFLHEFSCQLWNLIDGYHPVFGEVYLSNPRAVSARGPPLVPRPRPARARRWGGR